MAILLDQDQQWLVDCLSATLDNKQDVRSFAEASLRQAALQPGFGLALAKVAVNREVPFGLRQLAAVLLKQFAKQHWSEEDEGFVHPAVSSSEKASIRQLLISFLDDPHAKIRTAIGMAVAFIANYDWPEDWPELLPFLLKLITDQTNANGVHGALRCLALISDDLDDTLMPTLVPALFPSLHAIVTSPGIYGKSLRAKAISIVQSCMGVLASMSGVYKAETRELVVPMFKMWLEQFSIILQAPMQSEDPDDWNMRMEVLKCLIQFTVNFPSLMEAEFAGLIAPLWQTLVSCFRIYRLSLIQGSEDPYLGRCNSDGEEQSLESFAVQLFEFLITIVGNSRLAEAIGHKIEDLAYHTISFMQMTEDQVHVWAMDVNQYVADEDDSKYSCRIAGSILLEEVVNIYGTVGINSLVKAAQKHYTESCEAKHQGSKFWWKIHEACLLALSSISEPLLEALPSGLILVCVPELLDQMLIEDKSAGIHDYPFIHARAFATVAKFSSMINHSLLEQYIYAAIQTISLDVPPPVKVGACQVLSHLLPKLNLEFIQTQIMGLFSALTDLLNQASEETLHLVLETLQAAVQAGRELSSSIEPILSPIILNVWVQHVSDPFISIDALEVLEAIKNTPGCMQPLASRILPSICSILEKPQRQHDGLVAGSFDLLTMLLKNAPSDMVKAIFDTCFNSVVRIILHSDDHGELQNATECLAALVSGGKQHLIAWSSNPQVTMKCLLDAASRLLDPDLESSGSLFVGTYILQLILYFPSEMAVHIRELIAALVRRMQSAKIMGLRNSIIVIFARLVHLSSPNVEQFINLMLTIPASGYENALTYIMSEWTKQQGEILGAYQIKVTSTALALLLSTRHVDLAKINVQGQLVKSGVGITTRSKAKLVPEEWTVIPLPAKIFALLSDTLIEIQEQAIPDNDEDSDWEEVQEGGGDTQHGTLCSAGLSSRIKDPGEDLDAMAKVFNKSDDADDYEDDLLLGADPLNEINLSNYLTDFFSNFLKSDDALFNHLLQSSSPAERRAVKVALEKQNPSLSI